LTGEPAYWAEQLGYLEPLLGQTARVWLGLELEEGKLPDLSNVRAQRPASSITVQRGDARDLAHALGRRIDELVKQLLPEARMHASYWSVGSLQDDAGESLYIYRREGQSGKAGNWRDEATDESGDALDLVQQVACGGNRVEAMDWARAWLGWPAWKPNGARKEKPSHRAAFDRLPRGMLGQVFSGQEEPERVDEAPWSADGAAGEAPDDGRIAEAGSSGGGNDPGPPGEPSGGTGNGVDQAPGDGPRKEDLGKEFRQGAVGVGRANQGPADPEADRATFEAKIAGIRVMKADSVEYRSYFRQMIDGLLDACCAAMLYAQFGTGKTPFIMTICVAVAARWKEVFGRKIWKHGTVAYYATENFSGAEDTLIALRKVHSLAEGLPFYLLTGPLKLATDAEALVECLRRSVSPEDLSKLALIVFDTTNPILDGPENEGETWTGLLAGMAAIRREFTECATLVVHHPGKDEARGPRGSSVQLGNFDTILTVERAEEKVGGGISLKPPTEEQARAMAEQEAAAQLAVAEGRIPDLSGDGMMVGLPRMVSVVKGRRAGVGGVAGFRLQLARIGFNPAGAPDMAVVAIHDEGVVAVSETKKAGARKARPDRGEGRETMPDRQKAVLREIGVLLALVGVTASGTEEGVPGAGCRLVSREAVRKKCFDLFGGIDIEDKRGREANTLRKGVRESIASLIARKLAGGNDDWLWLTSEGIEWVKRQG
jgi:hypothetical protein